MKKDLQREKKKDSAPSLTPETRSRTTSKSEKEPSEETDGVSQGSQKQEPVPPVDGSQESPPADDDGIPSTEQVVSQGDGGVEESKGSDHREKDVADKKAGKQDEGPSKQGEGSINFKTETKWVERLQNIGRAEHVYFGVDPGKSKPKGEPLDPTEKYPKRPANLPRFESRSEVARWERELESRRVLVLGCLHSRLLHSAAYELLESKLLAQHDWRLLDFDLLKGEESSDLSFDSLAESKTDEDQNRVIVVNLKSKRFLDTMFRELSLLWRTHELLADRKSYILVLVRDREILDDLDAKLDESHDTEDERRYFFVRIPFLRPLLASYFSSSRASQLEQKITEQRAAGLWGETEDELFQWVKSFLKDGGRKLEEEVEARACRVSGASALDLRRMVKTVDAAELFKTIDDVGRTLLYTVAQFADLHPDEVEKLMLVLLEDRTTEVEVTEDEMAADGVRHRVTRKQERHLVELWSEGPDRFLRACHVQAVEQEDGSYSMEFTEPYLRRDLLGELRQRYPLFLRHRLGRIVEAGFLFEEDRRSRIRNRSIELAVEIALADPGTFDEWWLTRYVGGLKAVTANGAPNTQQQISFEGEPSLLSLFRIAKTENLRRRVLAGLSDLIREMLRHDRLRPLVETWMDRLIKSHHHREALRFVLDIFKALRFAPAFDSVRWFRRLLDESPMEAQGEVYDALLQSGIELRLRIYHLLEPLSEWLPDLEKQGPPDRPSGRYALEWMAEYCFRTLESFDPKKAGKWPSSYPLFGTLRSSGEETDARLRLVVRWLFHPAMKWVVEQDKIEAFEDQLWVLRAAVVEEWFWILQGAGEEGNEENEADRIAGGRVGTILLEQVVAATSSKDRARLLDLWRAWRAGYLRPLGLSMDLDKTVHYGKQRRICSLLLERKFKEIHCKQRQGPS